MKKTFSVFTRIIRFMALALLAGSVFIGCAAKASEDLAVPPSSNFVPKQTYAVSYDKLWDAVMGALDKKKIITLSADKASGIIQTDYFGEHERLLLGGFAGLGNSRWKCNLALRNEPDGNIKLNIIAKCESTISGTQRNYQWVDVSGQNVKAVKKVETWFYEQIEKELNTSDGGEKEVKGSVAIPPAMPTENISNSEVLTNDSIVQLVKAGIPEEIVISMIKTQPTRFDVGAGGVVALKTNGVSFNIINEMVLRGQIERLTPQAGLSEQTSDPVSNALRSASTESHKIKEPDFIGVFFRLNPTNGDLIYLERQNTQRRTSTADAFITVDTKTMMQIDGEKSPVRFKRGDQLDFIVKLNSQQDDPQSQIEFVLFESVKGKRQWVLEKGSSSTLSAFGSANDISRKKMVSYNFAKYGESSFKVSPINQLSRGEYLLGLNGVSASFCFGIDDDASSSSQSAGAINVITDPAVAKLCEALDQDNPGKVKDALNKLRDKKLKDTASQAVPKILPCLANSKPDVVREACRTLAKIGNQDAVPALLPLLTNERPDIVREACRTLAEIGNKDTIPSLEPLLTNLDHGISDEARKAIIKLRAKS